MLTQTRLMTAEEFLTRAPQDKRSELVKGEMIVMDPAGEEHGSEGMALAWRLAQFIATHKLGRSYMAETGFVLSRNPDTVRAPDFAFVSKERVPQGSRRRGFFEGAPDLAMEVASPHESAEDIQDKVIDYLSAGTRMVIYMHPRSKTITIYRSLSDIRVLTIQETLDGGDVLPGFRVPLREIYSEE